MFSIVVHITVNESISYHYLHTLVERMSVIFLPFQELNTNLMESRQLQQVIAVDVCVCVSVLQFFMNFRVKLSFVILMLSKHSNCCNSFKNILIWLYIFNLSSNTAFYSFGCVCYFLNANTDFLPLENTWVVYFLSGETNGFYKASKEYIWGSSKRADKEHGRQLYISNVNELICSYLPEMQNCVLIVE